MNKSILVILALVCVLAAPASAYTLLNDFVQPNSSYGYAIGTKLLSSNGADFLSNVTHIVYSGDISRSSAGMSETGSVGITFNDADTSALLGNGTLTWDVPSLHGLHSDGTFTIDIDDIAPNTQAAFIKIGGTNWAEHATYKLYGFDDAGSANNTLNAFIFWPPTTTYHNAGHYQVYSGTNVVTPEASFTCTPTSQFPDTDVVCTDTSTNTPTDWLWTIDAESVGIEGWQTSTSQNFSWQSHYPGLYSVNLRANNSAGSDWENKTNYVSISLNATPNTCSVPVVAGKIRSMAQCVNSQTNGAISGCDLSLLDKEGGSWSNVTDRFDGTWCIDTYPGHHIDAYGWADGYTPSPTYRFDLPASSSVMYELLMYPGYMPPAATGKVWLYIIVNDADTGASLSGARVQLDATGQTRKSDVTDATGSVHIQWANKTATWIHVGDMAGYGSADAYTTTSDYGPDTVRVELHRGTVTPTATATTGSGGTAVPTTDARTNTQKQDDVANLVLDNAYGLVAFFIMLIIIGGVKMISK